MLDADFADVGRTGDLMAGARMAEAFRWGEELAALEAAALPPRLIKANAELSAENAVMTHIYIVKTGWLCRHKTGKDGRRQITALLLPGDTANLDALMFDQPGYGLSALSDAKVIAIPRQRALALAEQFPAIAMSLVRLALIENALANQWALRLGHYSALQRIAHLFCEVAARLACIGMEGRSFTWPLTQGQLADAVGLSAVHVNRTLQKLRSDGLIALAQHTVTLLDVAQLREIAEFDPAYLHAKAGDASFGIAPMTGSHERAAMASRL